MLNEKEENEKQVRGIVLDPETMEIMYKIYEGDKLVRDKSQQSFIEKSKKEKELIPWGNEYPFYKGFINELKLIIPELSGTEKQFILSILPYISYDDCCIKDRKGNDIGTEELKFLTGLSRSVVYETINTLIEKDIIYKGKNSRNRQYFVNPWLFAKGKQINKVLQTMFKNYYIRMYSMTWKQFIDGGYKKIKKLKQNMELLED